MSDDALTDSIGLDFAARLRGAHRSTPNFSVAQKLTGNRSLEAVGEEQGTGAARQLHPTGLHR